MQEIVLDLAAELIAFVGLGIIGSVLSLLGFSMETIGFTSLTSGELVIGLWYLYMGSLALFVAVYLIGFRELPGRIASWDCIYRFARVGLAGGRSAA